MSRCVCFHETAPLLPWALHSFTLAESDYFAISPDNVVQLSSCLFWSLAFAFLLVHLLFVFLALLSAHFYVNTFFPFFSVILQSQSPV